VPALGIHREDAGIARIQGEQVAQERASLLHLGAQASERALDLLPHHALGIRVADAKGSPEHVDDRVQRHRVPEGERLSLDPRRVAGEPAVELA
jgi:hypothetical protein